MTESKENSELENEPVFKLNEKEMKIILNRQLYFKNHSKESEFSTLPGDVQRAVLREADFHTKTFAQTEKLNPVMSENDYEKMQEMHDALCEYMAHIGNLQQQKNPYNKENLFNKLQEKDSDAIYKQTLHPGKEKDYFHLSTEQAQKYNEHLNKERKDGKMEDGKELYNKIITHLKGNTRN